MEQINHCLLCGAELLYAQESTARVCEFCRGTYLSNAVCRKGHYVCDRCHARGSEELIPLMRASRLGDPVVLLEKFMHHPSVHMHGPEHHFLLPVALLVAYGQAGCDASFDLDRAVGEAVARAKNVPGGVCGMWGCCGAAIGAGIFLSIVLKSYPTNREVWSLPNLLTSKCLERIARAGSPRCCKRDSFLSVLATVEFLDEHLRVRLPKTQPVCRFGRYNQECIGERCPFHRSLN